MGVSNEAVVQILSIDEDEDPSKGIGKVKPMITVSLQLKGIRNLCLLNARHLVIETNT